MANDTQVANIILQQLGGAQFIALTGASKFCAGDQFLQFSLPKCQQGINKCRIMLTPMDTYTVEFFRITGATFERKLEFSDVYCDNLKDLFEASTGLYVTLFARR
jgi:hypothetical protein